MTSKNENSWPYLIPGKLYKDITFDPIDEAEILMYIGELTEAHETNMEIRGINKAAPISNFCGFLGPDGKLKKSFHKESAYAHNINEHLKRIL